MKKILTGVLIITGILGTVLEAKALTKFTTYTPLNQTYGTYYPNLSNRYNKYGRRLGTYVTNTSGITRSYDRYGRQNGVFIPTNRNINRTYYNRYNPNYYNYNGGFGGLRTYNRFGRQIR